MKRGNYKKANGIFFEESIMYRNRLNQNQIVKKSGSTVVSNCWFVNQGESLLITKTM